MALALLAYCAAAWIWGAWVLSRYPWLSETPAWTIGLAWLAMPAIFACALLVGLAELVGRLLKW